jgi:hypothetical protein
MKAKARSFIRAVPGDVGMAPTFPGQHTDDGDDGSDLRFLVRRRRRRKLGAVSAMTLAVAAWLRPFLDGAPRAKAKARSFIRADPDGRNGRLEAPDVVVDVVVDVDETARNHSTTTTTATTSTFTVRFFKSAAG